MNYSEEKNDQNITISDLNGLQFSSLITDTTPFGSFHVTDLNNNPVDNSKGRSITNLKSNPKFLELISDS